MKVFFGLILGIAIGAAAIWYFSADRVGHRDQNVTASSNDKTVDDKLNSFRLRAEDIKEDLAKTGRVIRDKAKDVGQKISDATADARTTTVIKAKLVKDPDLSALAVSVNTTDGVVTLSGTVTSEENIGKAMLLAIETDGVYQVVSTLQVKART